MGHRAASVFLNLPYDAAYESTFVGLIAAIVSVGRTPRCVLEVSEHGTGRLDRIIKHLRSCSFSIHDLSRGGSPARFNMPFELGLAVAMRSNGDGHSYMLLERKKHRLDRTLSDIKGRDPLIYGSSAKRLIAAIVGSLQTEKGRSVDPLIVNKVFRALRAVSPVLRHKHSTKTIFAPAVFRDLVAAATIVAEHHGLLKPD